MAETETIREKILAAIGVKLALATSANGYVLDCGTNVGRENLQSDADNVLPAFAYNSGDETAENIPRFVVCKMVVGVEGHVVIGDGDDQSKLKEQIRGDIIKIMTDRATIAATTGGLADDVKYTNSGNATAKASDNSVGIQVVFEVEYKFKTGDPFSQ